MFSLDLLGPVVLRRDGRALPLAVQKTQALLVLLAAGGTQPRSRIAAWLWPQLDEGTARRNLRRELARLREAGAVDVVRPDGELLALVDGLDSDLRRFASALKAGAADAALAEWRGLLADGLQLDEAPAFGEWLDAERRRWQALRRQALEQSAALREAGGAHDAALERIETLLADDPLQERYHRDAMRLHAAAGRRAAALAQYERCSALLQSELGLQPMAETAAQALALRTGESAAATAPPRPLMRTGPPGATPLVLPEPLPYVGREAEVAMLGAAWTGGQAMVIEGEAGVGKTRLAIDFAAAHGPYALVRCRPADAQLPYAAFARALRLLAGRQAPPDELAGWILHELARLLPEWGDPPPAVSSPDERARLVEACVQAWMVLAVGNFDAVIIDDWHLADSASQALWLQVAQRRAEQAPQSAREIWLLRPVADSPLRGLLHALVEGRAVTQLVLAPLSGSAVYQLLRALSGASDPQRFSARLHRATGGHPFFIAETLRHLAATGLLRSGGDGVWQTPFDDATEDYHELPVPASVHDAVRARVDTLPEAARRLLEAAALAGEPFAPALLAAACAQSELEALVAIEAALSARLLREHEAGGYAFAHDLVQHAIDASLAPARRRLVHRRLALGAEAALAEPAIIAGHWGASGEPRRAVPHHIAAAERAWRLYSDEAAFTHWQAALDAGADAAQRVRVLGQRLLAQRSRADVPGMAASLAALDAIADQPGVDAATRDAALDAALEAASMCAMIDRAPECLQRLGAIEAEVRGDPRRWARLLEVRGGAFSVLGRREDSQADLEAALAVDGLGLEQQARLHDGLMFGQHLAGRSAAALVHARRALATWQRLGARRGVARGRTVVGILLSTLDQRDEAIIELEAGLAMARELNMVEQQREAIGNLIDIAADAGDSARALALADEGWNASPYFPRLTRKYTLMIGYFAGRLHRGELGLALEWEAHAMALAAEVRTDATLVDCVSMVLDLHSWIGDVDGGESLLRQVAQAGLRSDGYYATKLAFNRCFFELRRGDPGAARQALEAAGDPTALEQPEDRASWALRAAQIALALDQPREALEHLAPWRTPGALPNVELIAASHTAALTARRRLGQTDAALLAAADTALATGRLPALEALALRRERRDGARASGDAARADALCAEIDRDVARLAASLDDWPSLRACFLARQG